MKKNFITSCYFEDEDSNIVSTNSEDLVCLKKDPLYEEIIALTKEAFGEELLLLESHRENEGIASFILFNEYMAHESFFSTEYWLANQIFQVCIINNSVIRVLMELPKDFDINAEEEKDRVANFLNALYGKVFVKDDYYMYIEILETF